MGWTGGDSSLKAGAPRRQRFIPAPPHQQAAAAHSPMLNRPYLIPAPLCPSPPRRLLSCALTCFPCLSSVQIALMYGLVDADGEYDEDAVHALQVRGFSHSYPTYLPHRSHSRPTHLLSPSPPPYFIPTASTTYSSAVGCFPSLAPALSPPSAPRPRLRRSWPSQSRTHRSL
jgi:hypothetical protein